MLEQFLNAVYTPNRAVEIFNAISLLYRFGMTGHTDRIDHLMMGEQGIEPEVIAGNLETFMVDGLMQSFNQFGVSISYEPTQLAATADMLEFLVTWDTADGVSPSSYTDLSNIHELGNSNEDILIELFEMAGKNHDDRFIDWIDSVSDFLIDRIALSFAQRPVLSDEASSIPVAALSDFRVFAAHYPGASVTAYVKSGGAIGLSMSTMMLTNDKWFEGKPVEQMAVEIAGMALISDLPRLDIRVEVAKLIEPVLGSTLQGQRVVAEINKILTKVLSNG